MGIPSAFALYLITFKCFITAKDVFDGSSHYMVNAGKSVGRGRALIKIERLLSFTGGNALLENAVILPFLQNVFSYSRKVKLLVFSVFHVVKKEWRS